MSEFENMEAVELSMDELDQAAGGASRYAPLKSRIGFLIYKVKAGDTLTKIANTYRCTVSDIMRWNPKITNKSRIYANEYLYIRA